MGKRAPRQRRSLALLSGEDVITGLAHPCVLRVRRFSGKLMGVQLAHWVAGPRGVSGQHSPEVQFSFTDVG